MKFYKHFLLILSLVIFSTSTIAATKLFHKGLKSGNNVIHLIHFYTADGQTARDVNLVARFGKWDSKSNVCLINKQFRFGDDDVENGLTFEMSNDDLDYLMPDSDKSTVSCAVLDFTHNGNTVTDIFQLYSNGSSYTGSNPFQTIINLK